MSVGLMLASALPSLLLLGLYSVAASHGGRTSLSTLDWILGWLPLLAVGVGVLLTVVGGSLAARRGTPPSPWIVSSWAVFLLSVVPAMLVVLG
ncbi:hypothetical protein [Actinocrispum wychmicini]|uniref:hypothetical protein n=1 Tax=Actinocrispum wychmicini TaxID=1213861 RepID=UPI0010515D91|nr:hypothetical protein [Actinocrispum wychmicini]